MVWIGKIDLFALGYDWFLKNSSIACEILLQLSHAGLISYCHYRGKQHATAKDQNVVDAISQSEDVLLVYFSQPQRDDTLPLAKAVKNK
jgi:alpha-D-ribose 1-methylphosphonate 5-triphosphate synthase subunit PhnG